MIYDFIKKCNFNKDSIIFEIGSHMGFDTEKIYNLSNNAEIHSFEPDPRNLEILNKREITKIAKINSYAISNQDGESDFILSSGKPPGDCGYDIINNSDWSASSSLRNPKEVLELVPWCKFENKIKVNTKKLDSYCMENNIKKIDFIWMDVQGCEDLVFEGAINILNNTKYIFTEYSNKEYYDGQKNIDDLIKLLPGNWIIRFKLENDVLLENRTLREKLIHKSGYWTELDLNDHVIDNSLCNEIISFIKEENLKNCIDIGCGNGFYTDEISKNIQCIGIDGNPQTKTSDNIFVQDITKKFNYGKFDVVLCLEVGEHIDKKYESTILKNITNHVGKYLIISWAIPGQSGYGHVNCNSNEYIKEKIEKMNFKNNISLENRFRNSSSLDWFKNTIMVFEK